MSFNLDSFLFTIPFIILKFPSRLKELFIESNNTVPKSDDLIILSICFEINILFFNDSSELDLFFDESDDEVSPDWFDPIPITIKTIIPTIIFFFLLQFFLYFS